MKIEVGKVYDTRGGYRVLILCRYDFLHHNYIGITLPEGSTEVYTLNGNYLDDGDEEHYADLVALSEDQSHDLILPNTVSECKSEVRRAIQLVFNEHENHLYVLCNDGSIWCRNRMGAWKYVDNHIPEFDDIPEISNG